MKISCGQSTRIKTVELATSFEWCYLEEILQGSILTSTNNGNQYTNQESTDLTSFMPNVENFASYSSFQCSAKVSQTRPFACIKIATNFSNVDSGTLSIQVVKATYTAT